MAGLHHAVPVDSAGAGAAGKGEEGDALLHYAGPLHPFQLLYFHHDLHFHGYLCDCADDAQSAQKLWGVHGNRAAVCLLFPFGRRSCRGGAFAGDLCAAGHGVRGF